MDFNEALNEAKKKNKGYFLAQAIDLGTEWGFIFSDEQLEPDEPLYGGTYDIFNKKTGKHSKLPVNITTLDRLSKAKRINV